MIIRPFSISRITELQDVILIRLQVAWGYVVQDYFPISGCMLALSFLPFLIYLVYTFF
jgi:hypothetical protein